MSITVKREKDNDEIINYPDYSDESQEAGFDDMQASLDYFEGVATSTTQKLVITAKIGKSGYEAAVLNRPDVKKKTSRVSQDSAAWELENHMNLAWDNFKDVASFRDPATGRRMYEYTGEPF